MQQLPIQTQWWSTRIMQQSQFRLQCSALGGMILPQGSHHVNLQIWGTCRESSCICFFLALLISRSSTSSSFWRITNMLGACSWDIYMWRIIARLKHFKRYSLRLRPLSSSIRSNYFGCTNCDFNRSINCWVTSPGCVTKVWNIDTKVRPKTTIKVTE
jgi:hypothetical protein